MESAISITPYLDYTLFWSNDNRTLTLEFYYSFTHNMHYQISISTAAKDLVGHKIENKYELGFTTGGKPGNGNGSPIINLLSILVLAILVIMIIVGLIIVKKKKAEQEGMGTSPQARLSTIQISCPQCGYDIQVIDTGSPVQIQCPNCGLSGKLK